MAGATTNGPWRWSIHVRNIYNVSIDFVPALILNYCLFSRHCAGRRSHLFDKTYVIKTNYLHLLVKGILMIACAAAGKIYHRN